MEDPREKISPLLRQSLLEMQKRFYKAGLATIPVEGKSPAINGPRWQNFDIKEGNESYKNKYLQYPNKLLNIGILTGKINNLLVVDIDKLKENEKAKDGLAEYQKWLDEHNKGESLNTPTSKTGRGGLHLFFNYDEEMSCITKAGGYTIDIKGEGGMVVGPGSIHPDTGQRYHFINEWTEEDIAENSDKKMDIPKWLKVKLLTKKESPKKEKERPKEITNELEIDEDLLYGIATSLSPNRAIGYSGWMNTIWCLRSLAGDTDATVEAVHKFSQLAGDDYDEEGTETMLENFDPQRAPNPMKLLAWLKDDLEELAHSDDCNEDEVQEKMKNCAAVISELSRYLDARKKDYAINKKKIELIDQLKAAKTYSQMRRLLHKQRFDDENVVIEHLKKCVKFVDSGLDEIYCTTREPTTGTLYEHSKAANSFFNSANNWTIKIKRKIEKKEEIPDIRTTDIWKKDYCQYVINAGKENEKQCDRRKIEGNFCEKCAKKGPMKTAKEDEGDGYTSWKLGSFIKAHLYKFEYSGTVMRPIRADREILREIIIAGDKYLNTFCGIATTPKENSELLELFLDHVLKVIAKGNVNHYNYILNYIADIFQNPERKSLVALLLIGEQGAGKNSLTTLLLKIIGSVYSVLCKNTKDVLGDFNALLFGKWAVVLDEVDIPEKFAELVKALVTEETTNITFKFVDPKAMVSICRFILLSNHKIHPWIKKGDRRVAVFECSSEKISDRAYFNKLYDSYTPEMLQAALHFFLNRDISDFDLKDIPETDIRKEILREGTNDVEVFLDDEEAGFGCLTDDDQWKENGLIFRNTGYLELPVIKLLEMYDYYKLWAKFRELPKRDYNFFKNAVNSKWPNCITKELLIIKDDINLTKSKTISPPMWIMEHLDSFTLVRHETGNREDKKKTFRKKLAKNV
jgi:hypothetical protein